MPTINVRKVNVSTFEVTVQDKTASQHTVTVPPEYVSKLTGGKVTAEQLVSRSFDFLLEREANTSILRHFELPVIARYFPEYEREIHKMLE